MSTVSESDNQRNLSLAVACIFAAHDFNVHNASQIVQTLISHLCVKHSVKHFGSKQPFFRESSKDSAERLTSPLCQMDATKTLQQFDIQRKKAVIADCLVSGKRDSNSRPQPWQGCALPTELFPHSVGHLSRLRVQR